MLLVFEKSSDPSGVLVKSREWVILALIMGAGQLIRCKYLTR